MFTFNEGAVGAPSQAAAYANYLTETTLPEEQRRLASYYCAVPGAADGPTVRADLRPEVARTFGIAPGATLDAADLTNLLAARRADGGDLPGHHREVRHYKAAAGGGGPERERVAWIDLTFSVPKSVSVAWAMAGTEAERAAILDACRAANDAALRYVEREAAKDREGEGRGHIAWATVPHFMARPTIEVTRPDPQTGVVATEIHAVPTGGAAAGDPQIHFHNVIPTAMVMEDGRVLSLWTRRVTERIKEFGAVGQAVLATELRKLGIRVELDERTGLATLPAIPRSAVEHFSKRTSHGLDAARDFAKAQGLDWDALDGGRRIALLKAAVQKQKLAKDAAAPARAAAFAAAPRRDGLADFAAWRAQAEAIGWRYSGTAESYGPPAPERDRAERLEETTGVALLILADDLAKEAVQDGTVARIAIARGLIVAGTGKDVGEDMDAVAREMAHGRGVMQDGKWTRLLLRRGEGGRVRITTALHRDQERALINLARHAAADTAGALSEGELKAAIGRTGLTLSAEQENAVRELGTKGRLAVALGSAGSGKSTTLRPLTDAWHSRGADVWGVATAWRQANALTEAGIPGLRTWALQPFLDNIAAGKTKLGPNSVVVLDELGQVGTRQMLGLLEAQAERGFKVVAVGDDRQCRSVEAGPTMDLLREALGPDAIPEILASVRQRTEREREIAGLFRERKVEEALAMKRDDGTAELVPGGAAEAVERVVALWAERRAANAEDPRFTITVSAPTNADARAIAERIRERRLAAGEIDADPRRTVQILATDRAGDSYAMQVAAGDRVRLFERTWGVAPTADGRNRGRHIGNNGTVLDVVEVRTDLRHGGLVLRNAETGTQAFVAWDKLHDRATGQLRLAYGDCLTIDSAQGITSDEHINAMPNGSRAVPANKAYTAESRHRVTVWMVGSMGAEMRQVQERRPRGVETQVTAEEAWANVARNLGRETVKESALAFLREAHGLMRRAAAERLRTQRVRERRAAAGYPPTTLARNVERRRAGRAVERVAEAVERVERVAEGMAPPPPHPQQPRQTPPTKPPPRPIRLPAHRVRISEADAQAQFAGAMRAAGFRLAGAPVMDGRAHSVAAPGDKGREKSGGYVGHYDDRPAGAFWTFKGGGQRWTWKAEGETVAMSSAEAEARAVRAAADAADRERARGARQEAVARQAAWILEGTRPADPSHPYLARKGVEPHGVRQDAAGRLVIPLRDADGRLWNLQTIGADGTKLFLSGGRKAGVHHVLGDPRPGEPVAIVEGFATGASVRQASGLPVVVALDAGNLAPVAEAIRARDPDRPLVFAADNDAHLTRRDPPLPNAGLEKATHAARAVGNARVAAPEFAPHEQGTDWNDFAARRGLKAAGEALREGLRDVGPLPVSPGVARGAARGREGPQMER